MSESRKLLKDYVSSRSEPAFRELVERYVSLVHSVALRLASGDTHLAEDVTQIVFADLATMAPKLPEEVLLGGWLHQHTCFITNRTLRTERRRRIRERQAAEMNSQQDHTEANLARIAPILDEAIGRLGTSDRTAIILRYFEQYDLRSVGEALGTTEDAAQKRVDRALEKLHVLLKHRGATLSAAALGTALAAEAVTAAPAGLAGAVTTAALSGTATTVGLTAMTTLQKTLIAGTLIAAVGTGMYEARRASILQAQVQTLQQQQAPLTEQIQELQRQREEAAQQLAALQRSQPRDLLRLRNEVGLLRQQTNALTQQLSEIRRGTEAIARRSNSAVKPIPCDSCIFSGYAAPEAAFQTYVWALRQHNLQAYLDCFTPAAREAAAKEFEGKSEAEIMGILIGKLNGAAALRMDRKETQEDGAVAFPLSSTEIDDGLNVSKATHMIRFRNVAGEWRLGE